MISVTIITKNEEKNIRRCLESVRWADEIIVMDSGSDDATEAICKEYDKVKFFVHPWLGFGPQKNAALGLASGDWILSLDADETVSPELAQEILNVIDTATSDGFFIRRKNMFRGKWIRHCGWWPDKLLRLFRKGVGRFSDRPVHESVELKGASACLNGTITHFTYASLSDLLRKSELYSTLGARLMFEKGVKPSFLKAVIHGISAFIKSYFLKLGILEGSTGFVIAFTSSFYKFSRYIKLMELYESRQSIENFCETGKCR